MEGVVFVSNSVWQGKKIRLRAVEPEDWEVHFAWNQDSEVARRLDFVWPPGSKEGAKRWAEETSREQPKNDHFQFAMENLAGEHVGLIGTHHCDRRTGTFEYGIAVRAEHQSKGYASEAVRLLLRYFFEELRYQKVTVHVYSFNEPSLKLHESLGMQREGQIRRLVYTGGQFYDDVIFGMTAEEFAADQRKKLDE